MSDVSESFEFERKFLVSDPKVIEGVSPEIILQGYLEVRENYAVRVRLVYDGDVSSYLWLLNASDCRTVVCDSDRRARSATLTVKSPPLNGARYEAEMDLSTSVASHLCRLSRAYIIKARYPIIQGNDLWTLDVFYGANASLVIAECERDQPVIDLDIPSFCGPEITDNRDYLNESLAVRPRPNTG